MRWSNRKRRKYYHNRGDEYYCLPYFFNISFAVPAFFDFNALNKPTSNPCFVTISSASEDEEDNDSEEYEEVTIGDLSEACTFLEGTRSGWKYWNPHPLRKQRNIKNKRKCIPMSVYCNYCERKVRLNDVGRYVNTYLLSWSDLLLSEYLYHLHLRC